MSNPNGACKIQARMPSRSTWLPAASGVMSASVEPDCACYRCLRIIVAHTAMMRPGVLETLLRQTVCPPACLLGPSQENLFIFFQNLI